MSDLSAASASGLAPGAPGIPPTWNSSAKSGVGTALNYSSRVWFTLSHGIFNEIFYPRVDQVCVRDMGLLVSDGKNYFSEEKRHASHQVEYIVQDVPAYRLTNTCLQGRYRIEKEIIADPRRDVILQRTRFIPLAGKLEDVHLYVLIAPHLGNQGRNNTGWVGSYKGIPMLMAEHASKSPSSLPGSDASLALACSAPWLKRSVGYVGVSDGWQDVSQHYLMEWTYERAEDGNIALIGEIDLAACGGEFLLVLAFGVLAEEAGQRALASLSDGFDSAYTVYAAEWQSWQRSLQPLERQVAPEPRDLYHVSTLVLRTHESKRFPGGLIASLSIPWGFSKGDDDLGGYHLAWPRDLVESAGALLAAGAAGDVRRVLFYLQVTQESDGHWPQNMWLDGRPYWEGIQMDETAFPILLVDLARRESALHPDDMRRVWPMVRRAAGFLVRNGPVSQEDRWEEDPGYSPFTLAVEIAGLLAAADLAEIKHEQPAADYLRQTADTWNEGIEHWTYVSGTELARKSGVKGYYVRISPADAAESVSVAKGFVPIKNRPPSSSRARAGHIISPDALALVRFGLRAPDDPRILDTLKVVDRLLKFETPFGPTWRRYNEDGYGEQEDGGPFNGTGIGRGWPLLTGERAHYELAAGHPEEALKLLRTIEAFANEGGMIPEQVWDCPDMPERELFFGRPSGSAMPLVWAHGEYIKLRRSLRDGKLFDLPPQTVQRYQVERRESPVQSWRWNQKCLTIRAGKNLRIELPEPAQVHWSAAKTAASAPATTQDTGLGIHFVDLPTADLKAGKSIRFQVNSSSEECIVKITLKS